MEKTIVAFACVAAWLACSSSGGNDSPTQPTPAPQPPPRPTTTHDAAAPEGVEVFVNDKRAVTVARTQLSAWPRLDSLLPEEARRLGTWQSITISARGAADSQFARPSMTFPDALPALYLVGERPAFGYFDAVELARHGKAGVEVLDVTAIRIQLSTEGRSGDHQGGAQASDPTKLVLAIKLASGEKQLTGAQILALPREPTPGNEDAKGWRLTQLLGAAGVTKFRRLVLYDAAGMSIPLARSDFDDKSTVPFIKLNRQGALRFRIYKRQGQGWQASGDLRALATIKVE